MNEEEAVEVQEDSEMRYVEQAIEPNFPSLVCNFAGCLLLGFHLILMGSVLGSSCLGLILAVSDVKSSQLVPELLLLLLRAFLPSSGFCFGLLVIPFINNNSSWAAISDIISQFLSTSVD